MIDDCDFLESLSPFDRELMLMKIWAKDERIPAFMTWELTPYCNFNCPMCYIHLTPAMAKEKGTLLTAAQWLELARQFADMGLFCLNLSGGEPLLRPDFWEIYEGICKLGILPTVFSNGYLIDEKAIEHFKAFPPRMVKISLYGGCNETYESMCGVKNGFTRVCHALDLLKENDIPIMLTATFVKQNEQDIPLMYKMAFDRQLHLMGTSEIVMSARGAASDPLNARLEHRNVLNLNVDYLKTRKHSRFRSPTQWCSSFGRNGVITWHGHLQICNLFEHEYIPLVEPYDVKSAWNAMLTQVEAFRMPPECLECKDAEFCGACLGKRAADSGHPYQIVPFLCEEAAILHKRYDELVGGRSADTEKMTAAGDEKAE